MDNAIYAFVKKLEAHCFFFSLMSRGLGRKNCLSMNLRASSMKLSTVRDVTIVGRKTHMTGKLMTRTACHSLQLSGTIENKVWRKGV